MLYLLTYTTFKYLLLTYIINILKYISRRTISQHFQTKKLHVINQFRLNDCLIINFTFLFTYFLLYIKIKKKLLKPNLFHSYFFVFFTAMNHRVYLRELPEMGLTFIMSKCIIYALKQIAMITSFENNTNLSENVAIEKYSLY